MTYRKDTIAALSSAPGPGGRAVVRLSGPGAETIARSLCEAKASLPSAGPAAAAVTVRWTEGGGGVEGRLYLMRAPRSYTRESVAELHVPSSPALVSTLLEACFRAGARPAGPGEFTLRAFLNGRIDLSRAEAVNKLIRAGDDGARREALRELAGGVAREVERLTGRLLRVLSWVETRVDFTDEDLDPAEGVKIGRELEALEADLDALITRTEASRERGVPLAILAGRPNAGKSSLFNRLTEALRSVVTPVAGTTRDVVCAEVRSGAGTYLLADPAGPGGESGPVAEKARIMFERWMEGADLVLLVLDGSRIGGAVEEDLRRRSGGRPVLTILNKSDLPSAWSEKALRRQGPELRSVSARTGAGVDRLREEIGDRFARHVHRPPEAFGLNARQKAEISEARRFLAAGRASLARGEEDLTALEIRDGMETLSRLTGRELTEAVLGEIFSNFCVGK
jgi:tRNA modification GTPase